MTLLTHCLTCQQRCGFPTRQVISMGDLFSYLFIFMAEFRIFVLQCIEVVSDMTEEIKELQNHRDSNKRCCRCIVKYRI